jgi:hypothetical protein
MPEFVIEKKVVGRVLKERKRYVTKRKRERELVKSDSYV